jgi:hypothetical protein
MARVKQRVLAAIAAADDVRRARKAHEATRADMEAAIARLVLAVCGEFSIVPPPMPEQEPDPEAEP